MQVGVYGGGKMGEALALRLIETGHSVCLYNRSPLGEKKIERLAGVSIFHDLEPFFACQSTPRVLWLMVPAQSMDDIQEQLAHYLREDDILLDGGNCHYKDTLVRHARWERVGVGYVDVGIGGGLEGLRKGACFMVGGDESVVRRVERLFVDLAHEGGYAYLGNSGSGHYVKMVHNGVEYAMMAAIGEGLDLLSSGPYPVDLSQTCSIWSNGSTISGSLMSLSAEVLGDPDFEQVRGIIDTSGEAGWTLQESLERHVAIPTLASALFSRFKSKDADRLSERMVALLRRAFGGHEVYKK